MKKYVLAIVDKGDYFVTEGFYHDSPMVKKPLTKEEFIDIRSFSYFPERFFSFGCFKDYIGNVLVKNSLLSDIANHSFEHFN